MPVKHGRLTGTCNMLLTASHPSEHNAVRGKPPTMKSHSGVYVPLTDGPIISSRLTLTLFVC